MAGTEFQPSTGKTDPVPCQNGVTSENKEVVSGGDKMETCDTADSSNRRPGKRNLSATLTASPSRRARFDLYDFNPNNDDLAQIILQECPEGVNPLLWDMLKSIKQDTAKSSSKADEALNRVGILEDQADNTGAQIACIKREMAALTLSNKVLSARLQRAECVIQRQKADILDLRGRSMRDNIIVKTKGETYRELREENTALKFRSFLANEMRVANVDRIEIPRSHRMGRAGNGYNRMMIAKVPMESDQRRIFANTKALKNTDFSISKQVPHEIEERRIFGWQIYKKARQEKRPARFDGGKLFVENEAVAEVDPSPLPSASAVLEGTEDARPSMGSSDERDVSDHIFSAWAAPANDLQGVREGYDTALADGLSAATHAPYAFRFKNEDGSITENFESDGDNGAGLALLKFLREKKVTDAAVYISHQDRPNRPLALKLKSSTMQKVAEEALLDLGRRVANM